MRFDARFEVSLMLKGGHHCEEHSHQAFLGDVRLSAQRAEANGRVDAIAQEDQAGRNFTLEERL